MFRRPRSFRPTRPDRRAPPSMGTGAPFSSPMDRLKNGTRSLVSYVRPIWNEPWFSRKNSRFSGKNRLKRVRFTCCASASTCEKSVR
jgi:hypothetical protein